MKLSAAAQKILSQIKDTKLGELRIIAKEIKKDHHLAIELWSSCKYLPRQLVILIMDKKLLTPALTDELINDIAQHPQEEKLSLIDWLMANQLSKDKKTIELMKSWESNKEDLKRRTFWYYQGRLRRVGQTPPPNTEIILKAIEKKLAAELPEV